MPGSQSCQETGPGEGVPHSSSKLPIVPFPLGFFVPPILSRLNRFLTLPTLEGAGKPLREKAFSLSFSNVKPSELSRSPASVSHSAPLAPDMSVGPRPLIGGCRLSFAWARKKLLRFGLSLLRLRVWLRLISLSGWLVVSSFIREMESFFRPPRKLRRAPRPCLRETGWTVDTSSAVVPLTADAPFFCDCC